MAVLGAVVVYVVGCVRRASLPVCLAGCLPACLPACVFVCPCLPVCTCLHLHTGRVHQEEPEVLLPAFPPLLPQTAASSSSSSGQAWASLAGAQPLPLHLRDAKGVYGSRHSVSEKNWAPFVQEGGLFVSHSLAPRHRVYRLHPDGSAEPQYETDTGMVICVFWW